MSTAESFAAGRIVSLLNLMKRSEISVAKLCFLVFTTPLIIFSDLCPSVGGISPDSLSFRLFEFDGNSGAPIDGSAREL